MGAAVKTVADWALDSGSLDRLELGVRVNNPASIRIAEKSGFLLEGVERQKFLIDGKRIDARSYARQADRTGRTVCATYGLIVGLPLPD